jgi:acetylornithine aminotransferase
MFKVMQVYDRLPIHFERGEGVWVYDNKGQAFLDAQSGLGVTALGHSHPKIVEAICSQAKKILHTSNAFMIEEQELLAQELTELAEMDQAFFSNSGAEANEAAIKLTRLYGHHKNIEQPAIIVTEKSYHGRTMATLSASGNRKIQAGYEPLVSGYIRVPYNDLDAIKNIATHNKNIVAVMVEPILGNGGIVIPDDNYLQGIREICDANEWLMILDEIQTGLCRTGAFYSYQHHKILPDIVTTAKALANGIPIASCLATNTIANLFHLGKHGSTFGGNPFTCHVSRQVLRVMKEENVCANAQLIGDYLLNNLKECLQNQPGVSDVRGKGMMIGVELDRPCHHLYQHGLNNHIIFSITAEKVIRIMPPLISTKQDADMMCERLCRSITDFYNAESK